MRQVGSIAVQEFPESRGGNGEFQVHLRALHGEPGLHRRQPQAEGGRGEEREGVHYVGDRQGGMGGLTPKKEM